MAQGTCAVPFPTLTVQFSKFGLVSGLINEAGRLLGRLSLFRSEAWEDEMRQDLPIYDCLAMRLAVRLAVNK